MTSINRYKNIYSFLANFISIVFSPFLAIPTLFILLLTKLPLSIDQKIKIAFVVIGSGILPIFLIFFYLLKKGVISDFDMQKRQERYLFNLLVLCANIIMLIFLFQVDRGKVFNLGVILIIWFSLYTVITFFWKISAHVAGITLLTLNLVYFYGMTLSWILFLIPIVAWARIYRKNHSLSQVIGGIILSSVVFIFAYIGHLI